MAIRFRLFVVGVFLFSLFLATSVYIHTKQNVNVAVIRKSENNIGQNQQFQNQNVQPQQTFTEPSSSNRGETFPRCPESMTLNTSQFYTNVTHQSKYVPGRRQYTEKILILTPISNSAKRLGSFMHILCSLNYPHHLISIAFGEDSSTDKSFEIATNLARKMLPYFRRINVFHLDENIEHRPIYTRHDHDWQFVRRRHLAHSRNDLLSRALDDEDWVLWIDSDVAFVPPDIVQHLLSAEADVVAPCCLHTRGKGVTKVYDKNTWRETNDSIAFLREQKPEYLMLEGYTLTKRKYLPYLAHEGEVVDIDGVGGCTLLVRAQSHRQGLNFPPYILDHHIETEGLAKMAARMKLKIKGLPLVSVFHA